MDIVSDRLVTRPPYEAYGTIMAVFVGGIAVAGGVARLLGRDPREHTFLDLVALSAAWSRRSASSSRAAAALARGPRRDSRTRR